MRALARFCICLPAIAVLAWALPALYDTALLKPLDKTHIFYSPVLKQCIYTEQIRGYDAQAAEKSEGHHADIVYKDEKGRYYDRLAFEAALPFIYFRNMEMRGLLPLNLEGRILDRPAIERARRVLELPSRHLDGKRPPQNTLPLLEANPGQAALLYPTDRFRLTAQGMDFIHADTNAPETNLARIFTSALAEQGFLFPARHVGGNFTTFKPYESGIFLVDAQGRLFHLLRRDGRPQIRKPPLPEGLVPRHVLVSESRERLWLGLLLDSQDRLWLIRQDDLALIGLNVPDYRPDSMDCKLIFDPLYVTVVTSDASRVRATVFDLPPADTPHGEIHEPFHSFSHSMSRAAESWQSNLSATLFPFRLIFGSEDSALLLPHIAFSRHWSRNALPFCLVLAALYAFSLHRSSFSRARLLAEATLVLAAGIHALLALALLREKE